MNYYIYDIISLLNDASITFFQYSLYSLFLLALRDSTHLNSFMFRQRVTLAINQVQVVGPENTNFSSVMLQLQSSICFF